MAATRFIAQATSTGVTISTMYTVFSVSSAAIIQRLGFTWRSGTEAHMNRRAAQTSAAVPMQAARIPQIPGAGRKTKAAKWTAIMVQAVSQILDWGV